MTLLTFLEQNGWKQRQALTSTKAGWWKQMCCSCPEILRDFPRAYNPPCLLVSTVAFRQTWQKGWKIQYLQLYIHAKSRRFPRIVQENHQLSATFYCYVLVLTQRFIIIQFLLSLPLPGHTLITPFAVGQTQVCCGQLIKYSPLQTWLSI